MISYVIVAALAFTGGAVFAFLFARRNPKTIATINTVVTDATKPK